MSAAMVRPRKTAFESNVFVNCPFDGQFQPLFRALIFAIEYCGFSARCALETDDAGETRIEKLRRIIAECRFGVHDLSRIEANEAGLPRFNMPFELGVFLGFQWSGQSRQARKRALVLAHRPYLYQQYLSDIAGQDIQFHDTQPDRMIRVVRTWLASQKRQSLPFGGDFIVKQFQDFNNDIPIMLANLNKTEFDLQSYFEFHELVSVWIEKNTVK